MPVRRGDRLTVRRFDVTPRGLLVATDEGPAFLVREDPHLEVGDSLVVGSFCGAWALLRAGGRQVRAEFVEPGSPPEAGSPGV